MDILRADKQYFPITYNLVSQAKFSIFNDGLVSMCLILEIPIITVNIIMGYHRHLE